MALSLPRLWRSRLLCRATHGAPAAPAPPRGFRAVRALLAAAGGLFVRQRPRVQAAELPALRQQSFVLAAELRPSALLVEDGELRLPDGSAAWPSELHVLLKGEESHGSFFQPLPVRLRFLKGADPEVRIGGQLAFPLVARDRRPPQAFWLKLKEKGSGTEVTELLRCLREFLLDPSGYLGYAEDSAEQRRLLMWQKDVARVNSERLNVIRKYDMRHPDLFGAMQPLRPEWFHCWEALQRGERQMLTEQMPGVYSFPLFTEDFCDRLLEEIFHFYESGLPARRPNSMNNYGIILSDIGLEPFVDRLQGLLQALGETLFPGPGCAWDGHHCFIVRYREEEDLGLDMHTDDSDVTFNICLGLDFAGAGLQFCGLVGSSDHRQHRHTYEHRKGHCVVHLGRQRHGADDITRGERINLILWNHSSEYRSSKDYRYPGYAREGQKPDAVCLSYTHDRDYGTFKDYPKGKESFKGRGWCPPSQAEYEGFEAETRSRL